MSDLNLSSSDDGDADSQDLPDHSKLPASENPSAHSEPPDTAASAAHDSGQENASVAQLQKRRRVTRACDECRRKKIKCDGRQPCTHCTVYSYDCTYDQPSHRRRNPAPVFLEAMEQKLRRAERIVQLFFPGLALDDPKFDVLLQQGYVPDANGDAVRARLDALSTGPKSDMTAQDGQDTNLESMVRSTGSLDLDESGNWDYYGSSSGLNFLRRMGEEFAEIVRPDKAGYLVGRKNHQFTERDRILKPQKMSDVMMRSPRSPLGDPRSPTTDSQSERDGGADGLPIRQIARNLCEYALDDACAIICPVHQPSFYKSFDRIYDNPPDKYENQDHRFLPLLYVVMALGCLFARDEHSSLELGGYASATDQGYKYFWAARQLVDVTDCRDLTSLQAVVFMILFLQCSAKLSTCYSFVGVALRSALRMGLHRSFKDSFTPIEAEVRKRLFWFIRKVDVFVGAMLGLPQTLSEEDIDQDFPAEIDDEYITEDSIKPYPPGQTAMIAAANADFRLTKIVVKIIRSIYPIKGFQNREQDPSRVYSVSYAVIRDIEGDLQQWMLSLPDCFKPGGVAPPHIMRIRQLLRISYAHVQMILYRPFLHYASSRTHKKSIDPRSYACAAACVSVSRNIIHMTTDMKHNGLLVGSYWFTMYTAFFAVLSLVFYALENSDVSDDMMHDAREGKETLAALAKRSMAADRCTATLTVLFDQIGETLQKQKQQRQQQQPKGSGSNTSKKREAPRPQHLGRTVRSQPGSEHRRSPAGTPQRAATHPAIQQQPVARGQPSSLAPRPASQLQHAEARPLTYHGQESSPVRANFGPGVPANGPLNNGTEGPMLQDAQPYLPQSPSFLQMDAAQHSGVFSDLSAMMFPSPDPLVYPNQPMLTLEQSGGYHDPGFMKQGPSFGGEFGQDNFIPASTASAHSVNVDDHADVQMFGSMPQAMQQQFNNAMSGGRDAIGNMMIPPGHAVPGTSADMWDHQARAHGFPGVNFDDIFGGGQRWHDPRN